MSDLSIPGVPAPVLWVAVLVLKATLVLAAAGALTALLRRASAAFRHLVWSGALGALLMLPLLTASIPWRLALAVAPGAAAASAASSAAGAAAPTRRAPGPATPDAPTPAHTVGSGPGVTAGPAPHHRSSSLLDVALGLWAVGALALLGRLVLGGWKVRRLVRRAEPLSGDEWRIPLAEAGGRLALGRLPRLVMVSGPPMPFACGLVRPAIVLPRRAAEWDERRRRAVLCHELAHVRRADLRINAVAQLAAAVFWFHPLAWIALRRLRVESERACDDLVLSSGTRPSEYADHLLQIVSALRRTPVPAVALPFARRQEFEGRVLAILERGVARRPTSRWQVFILSGVALSLVVPLAALAPVRRQAPARPRQALARDAARVAVGPGHPATPSPRPAAHPAPSARPLAAGPDVRARVPAPGAGLRDSVNTLVVASLIRALGDPDRTVRENAVNALGHLAARGAVPAIGTTLRSDADGAVREMAAWALGQIGDTAAVASLSAATTGDGDTQVRLTSAWALGELGDAGAVPALVSALGDRSSDVRTRAAWALGTIVPGHAPSRLVAALADTTPEVRTEAAWALGQIADPAASAGLGRALDDRVTDVRRAAIWALGHLEGDSASVALVRALQDPDATLRAAAARALAGSGRDPWPQPMPIVR